MTPFHGQPTRVAARRDWSIDWPNEPVLGFGKNRLTVRFSTATTLDEPVELTVCSVVFSPEQPIRQHILTRKVRVAEEIPIEFTIDREGAAAVIVSADREGITLRDGRAFFVEPVHGTLQRARRLIGDSGVAATESLDALCRQTNALSAAEMAGGPNPWARMDLYRAARWLARRVAVENTIDFEELLLVKRFTQETYPDVCLNHMPWCSRPGGDVCVVTLGGADGPSKVRNLIDGQLGPGHVHGMDLWWDGDRVVFGYAKAKSDRPPPGWLDRTKSFELRRTEEPTHLFEIEIDGQGLRQLTNGQWSDLDPTYLPSGDVAFVSECCGYSLQCNEMDKDETSCNLFVMRSDGSDIRQLSVSKDGDYLPHALEDGTIGYTRWEYQERSFAHIQSIWTVRPDGTGADALFKQHMNDPWALEDARSIPGTSKLLAIATGHHTLAAGPVVIIDPREGLNSVAGIRIVTPGVVPPEGGMAGTPVEAGGVRGSGGYYMTPWPLSEESALVSYTYGPQTDPAGYAIYLIDVHGTKELIYRDESISCSIPIPLRPRPRPPILPDVTIPGNAYATCSIADVSRGVEAIPREAIRYVRVSHRLPWPYDNRAGGHRYEPDVKATRINWTPAQVIGTVPVQSDGSAFFRVPADVPVYFQLLDENQMELRRMRSFISFQPGEVRACVGCHQTKAVAPPANLRRFGEAFTGEPLVPSPPPWGDRPVSFLRDVQPVFDKHCVRCHGGLDSAGALDFSGGLTPSHNRAFDTILAADLISRSNVLDDAKVTSPLAFGSHRSRLVHVLREGECGKRTNLSRDDWIRLVTWIDANGPYHDRFLNKRPPQAPYNMATDRALIDGIAAAHARRCSNCHLPAQVTRVDWIDLKRPEQSLFLIAPLGRNAGGAGKCSGQVYQDTGDVDYRAVLDAVRTAVKKTWASPRRDVVSLKRTNR